MGVTIELLRQDVDLILEEGKGGATPFLKCSGCIPVLRQVPPVVCIAQATEAVDLPWPLLLHHLRFCLPLPGGSPVGQVLGGEQMHAFHGTHDTGNCGVALDWLGNWGHRSLRRLNLFGCQTSDLSRIMCLAVAGRER